MSTKPLRVPQLPTPGIVTVTPVPDGSVIDHDSRTVALPPIVTALGDAEKLLMVGAGHAVAVTVVWAELEEPQPVVTFSV